MQRRAGVWGEGDAQQQRVAVFLPRPPPAQHLSSGPSDPPPRCACPHARRALGLSVRRLGCLDIYAALNR